VIRSQDVRSFAVLLIVVLSTALATTSCSTAEPGPSSGTTLAPTPDTTPLTGFRTVTVTVVAADGTNRTICVLVADREELRQQGLMYVEDRSLGGHDGMLFVFADDVSGGFWMRHTRLPLSIAYIRADGSVVSTLDMAPCPDDEERCPTYPSGGEYRYAVEVPQGELDRLGIGAGSRVTVGSSTCGTTPATAS
jgi:uncharacterized membrane protein (UPF0127 family)